MTTHIKSADDVYLLNITFKNVKITSFKKDPTTIRSTSDA